MLSKEVRGLLIALTSLLSVYLVGVLVVFAVLSAVSATSPKGMSPRSGASAGGNNGHLSAHNPRNCPHPASTFLRVGRRRVSGWRAFRHGILSRSAQVAGFLFDPVRWEEGPLFIAILTRSLLTAGEYLYLGKL